MCSKRSTCCTLRWLGLRTAPTLGTIKRWHGATGWMSLNAMTVSSSYTMSAGSSFRTIRAKMFCSPLPLSDEGSIHRVESSRVESMGKGTDKNTRNEAKGEIKWGKFFICLSLLLLLYSPQTNDYRLDWTRRKSLYFFAIQNKAFNCAFKELPSCTAVRKHLLRVNV